MVNQRPLTSELQERVKEILIKHDPIGLVSLGAPNDEYSPESQMIAPQLRTNMSESDIVDIVHAEFVKWFYKKLAGDREQYMEIATDISRVIEENQDN